MQLPKDEQKNGTYKGLSKLDFRSSEQKKQKRSWKEKTIGKIENDF